MPLYCISLANTCDYEIQGYLGPYVLLQATKLAGGLLFLVIVNI
jgi:hypothetical protein